MMKLIVLLAFVALTCANYGSTAETNAPAEASVIVSEVPPATCEGEAVRSCAKKCKAHCNNGVGNGPDCRPGRARYSNDDHGGVPGSPGARGGGAAGTKYTTSEKGNNNIENGDLAFLGSLDGVFKKSKCHDDCEDAEFAKCKAPVASLPPATAAPQECVLPVGGNEKDCEKRSFDFCGPEVTSAFTTCRQVFTKFCVKPEPVTDAESCLRARCDTLPKDQWHSAAEKSAACRKGDGRGGVSQQCQEQICQKYTTKAPETTTKAVVYTTKGASVATTTKARETTTKATTTKAPETTTKAPETTTKAPETTTKAPETTTKAYTTTTKAPVVDRFTATPLNRTYAVPCKARPLELLREELLCLSRYVTVLAQAVAKTTVDGVVISSKLTVVQNNIVNAPVSAQEAAILDRLNGVASSARAGTNPDGSLTSDSIGAIVVGSVLGAALVAGLIVAFSVVRRKKKAAVDATSATPLLQQKGWQVE